MKNKQPANNKNRKTQFAEADASVSAKRAAKTDEKECCQGGACTVSWKPRTSAA